jgi:hypothetical protein
VWTFGVVFLTVLPAKHSCFEQVTEDFSAEEFVPESAVEAFDVAVFPGSTRSDESSLNVEPGQVTANCFGNELWPVVAPDEGRCSTLSNQPIQHVDDIGRGRRTRPSRSVDLESETFTGVLVDDRHPLETSSIGGGVEEKVVAPYVVRERWLQPNATVLAAAEPATFPRFPALREPILAPETVYSLGVDLLSVSAKHGGDASVSVAGMLEGKFLNTPDKSPIPVWILRLVSLR